MTVHSLPTPAASGPAILQLPPQGERRHRVRALAAIVVLGALFLQLFLSVVAPANERSLTRVRHSNAPVPPGYKSPRC